MRLINFNSNIIINIFEPRWTRKSTSMARKVLKVCNLRRKGISIIFSNDEQVKKLNFQWKNKNKPTNVLSFPNIENFSKNIKSSYYLGDIIYIRNPKRNEARKNLFSSHMSHLLVHGILHLQGYNHKKNKKE